jgi:hypothetical protein
VLDLYQYYVKTFYFAVKASFLTKKAMETKNTDDVKTALAAADELSVFRKELTERMEDTYYPFYMYWMLDESLLLSLETDIYDRLNEVLLKQNRGVCPAN